MLEYFPIEPICSYDLQREYAPPVGDCKTETNTEKHRYHGQTRYAMTLCKPYSNFQIVLKLLILLVFLAVATLPGLEPGLPP